MAKTFRRDTRERLYRARRISTTFARIYLGIKANQLLDGAVRANPAAKGGGLAFTPAPEGKSTRQRSNCAD